MNALKFWMPLMPRIRDAYLDCVVYLYPSEQYAEEGAQIGGSGFLVGINAENAGLWLTYVVTNRHVVENGSAVIRMRTKDGKNEIMPTDERDWRFHPDGDDLAVLLLQFNWRNVRFNFVPDSLFVSKNLVSQFNMGPGDEAFLVGRFINHEGRQQNLPTVRFGCIAQMPLEPIKQDTGFEQESFLVEARSIGGYSGSPVFTYIPFGSERENVENWAPGEDLSDHKNWSNDWGALKSHGPWLLGVDWGQINDWHPVCDKAGNPINHSGEYTMQVRLNTGMMAVVPAWKLTELLYTNEMVNQRKSMINQIQTVRCQAAPTATSD